MRLWACIFLCLLTGCSSTRLSITIPRPPCLYPFAHYDFTLCKPFIYTINQVVYKIPSGFTTDLASIPRLLWSIHAPFKANTIPGAIIHDYLYFCPGDLTRKEADSIFYEALIAKKVSVITAYKYWLAVRLFGKSHFNEGAVCSFGVSRIKNSVGDKRLRGVS